MYAFIDQENRFYLMYIDVHRVERVNKLLQCLLTQIIERRAACHQRRMQRYLFKPYCAVSTSSFSRYLDGKAINPYDRNSFSPYLDDVRIQNATCSMQCELLCRNFNDAGCRTKTLRSNALSLAAGRSNLVLLPFLHRPLLENADAIVDSLTVAVTTVGSRRLWGGTGND